jgi:GlpG protein
MRIIGHIEDEAKARVFSDFLLLQGIDNELESERHGRWAVWVRDEDSLESAQQHLDRFRSDSGNPEFASATRQAREMEAQEAKRTVAAAKRIHGPDRIFAAPGVWGISAVTFGLIVGSVAVYVLLQFIERNDRIAELLNGFVISEYPRPDRTAIWTLGFPEVRQGQVWRLITPIFLHFHILHILFNMLWMKDLGTMVESREGWRKMLALVFAVSVLSNAAEYIVTGPMFGGMSGVVYGLFGYIWIKGKCDPRSGLYLHPATVTMMIVWFFVCFSGILPIANTVHGVGLATGMIWGFLSAWWRLRAA